MGQVRHRRKHFRGGGPLEWVVNVDNSYTDAGGTTPAGDNGPIYRFIDQIGSVDLIQSTEANRFTYKAGIVNGKAVARVDGTNDIMYAGNSLNSVLAGPDKRWSHSINIANYPAIGDILYFIKHATGVGDDRQIRLYLKDRKPTLIYYEGGAPGKFGIIRADNALDGNPTVVTATYDDTLGPAAIDRVGIRVKGVNVPISDLGSTGFPFIIGANDAQITVGGLYTVAPSGGPIVYSDGFDWSEKRLRSDYTPETLDIDDAKLMNDWGL